jgi:dTDP-4-dehydrorhamnose reductase
VLAAAIPDAQVSSPRIIIVGGSGVIGTAFARMAMAAGRAVIATGNTRATSGQQPFDMRSDRLGDIVPELGGRDTVFLLAGYSAPSWIFAHPAEARALNLEASRRLADEAFSAGARLVFASTDQVFDGRRGGYIETDTPQPLNLYGQLKAKMESHVLARSGQGYVARMGWTVPWDASAHCGVTQCYEALLRPGARMARDNVINITDVDDVARGMLAMAADVPPPSAVYHLVGAPELSRVALADLIRDTSLRGTRMNYETIRFDQLTYTEPRPLRAFLRATRLNELGLHFGASTEIVRRKVALLDEAAGAKIAGSA